MMNALTNFAFEEHLVRLIMIDDQPWFIATDICRILDINQATRAVEKLDDDEKGVTSIHTLGGKQEVLTVSEGGLYTIILRSRAATTPGSVAHRFRRWVTAEVLPAIRRTGSYGVVPPEPVLIDQEAPLMARVEAVKVAARLFGRERARGLWDSLGPPTVPPAPPSVADTAPEDCLQHLLGHEPAGSSIQAMIIAAVSSKAMESALRNLGIRMEKDGFVVAASHPVMRQIYAGSRWHGGGWSRALRCLSGASVAKTMKYTPDVPGARGTFIPMGWAETGN
ncbi:MAG: BRO-N domain-containing protein [Rhizobiaceae bacterium]